MARIERDSERALVRGISTASNDRPASLDLSNVPECDDRLFCRRVFVRDAELFDRLQREVKRGDVILASSEFDWDARRDGTVLVDFESLGGRAAEAVIPE